MAGIQKGSRIRATWMAARPVALAGVMMKFEASPKEVTGTIRHFRGDDPINPKVVRIYVDPDGVWDGESTRPVGCTCEKPHVEVDPKHIVEVL